MLVDDDPFNILSLKALFDSNLRDWNITIEYHQALNGLKAIELIQDLELKEASSGIPLLPDLVIMDCNMPVMDGF